MLANRNVTITVHPAPTSADTLSSKFAAGKEKASERRWSRSELVEEAEKSIVSELRKLLEKDVLERVVGVQIRKMVADDRSRRDEIAKLRPEAQEKAQDVVHDKVDVERRGLKGLSFRKRKTEAKPDSIIPVPVQEVEAEPESTPSVVTPVDATKEPSVAVATGDEEDEEVVHPDSSDRPRKRRRQVVLDQDLESEDEDEAQPQEPNDLSAEAEIDVRDKDVPLAAEHAQQKREPSPEPTDEPPAKRPKVEIGLEEALIDDEAALKSEAQPVEPEVKGKKLTKKQQQQLEKEKYKKGTKRGKKAQAVVEELVIPLPTEIEPPAIAEVHVSPTSAILRSPSPPPSATEKQFVKHIKPLSEPVLREVIDDDEDVYLMKLALSTDVTDDDDFILPEVSVSPSDDDVPESLRTHYTGGARTEGYYKISHAEKSEYVAQYASRGDTGADTKAAEATPQPQHVVSSRSNRANARRRAQGLEEINQLQLAVALSKGETGATDAVKFNQLQTRKKHLRFARSPIHDWGLYAMERILKGEMVIEYVGEVIRAAVADKREKAYERQGIGSSYLFRIDEDLVVDATKKGNLGYAIYLLRIITLKINHRFSRLINHSCDPNCTAKIITINAEKKIVIYAKQDIELGDEITYGMPSRCLLKFLLLTE